MEVSPISSQVNSIFIKSRARYRAEHAAWTDLSGKLSGRFNLPVAVMNIQRQGDLDLLLRCMEDEFENNKATEIADTSGVFMAFHYQLMLSEAWVVGCYEILRAFRQRDYEALKLGVRPSGVSGMEAFKSVLADLELLRMPMTKFEIAKDKGLREPLRNAADQEVYNSKDPVRFHIMPAGIGPRGSAIWLAVDLSVRGEHPIERRDLAERLLAMGKEIVPAGILEAQERAAEEAKNKRT